MSLKRTTHDYQLWWKNIGDYPTYDYKYKYELPINPIRPNPIYVDTSIYYPITEPVKPLGGRKILASPRSGMNYAGGYS